MSLTDTLPTEVIREMEQSPVLQNYYAAQRLQAETAAQEAMNEQQRLHIKQQELEEQHRKNDIEEQRNADILKILTRIEQMYALTTSIMDAYIEKHHEPLYAIMQSVLTQLGLLLQSQNIVIPELIKRLGDPRLESAALQIYEGMIRQLQPQQGQTKGSTIIYAGDVPTNVNAPGATIHKMNIGDK